MSFVTWLLQNQTRNRKALAKSLSEQGQAMTLVSKQEKIRRRRKKILDSIREKINGV